MEKPTHEQLVKALRDAVKALENAGPIKAADWAQHEAAEKNAKELLARV